MKAEPAAANLVSRYAGQSVVSRGRLFMFGGFWTEDLKATSRAEVYSAETNTWSRIADLPVALTHAGIAEAGGAIWIAGGFAGDHPGPATCEVWRYDPDSGSWTMGPHLPDQRGGGALVAFENELHYFGGLKSDRQTDASDHWVLPLSPGAKWEVRAPMPDPRNQFGAVSLDGLIYAIGGARGHDAHTEDTTSVHVYEPDENSWRALAGLPKPRSHIEGGTFAAAGRIFVAGGRSNPSEMLYDFDVYDPATNKWEALPALPAPLRSPVATIVAGRLLIGSGATLPSGFRPSGAFYSVPLDQAGLRLAGARMSALKP